MVGDFANYPAACDIELSQKNEIMLGDFKAGIKRLLTSEIVVTFETSVDSGSTPGFSVPEARSLGRVAFMKIDELAAETQEAASQPSLQLALLLNGHGLNADTLETLRPEESAKVGLVWPDGIQMAVVDRLHQNFWSWGMAWLPKSSEVFMSGNKTGYTNGMSPEKQDKSLITSTYGINRGHGSGAYITEDGMSGFEELELVNAIIQNGTHDEVAEIAFLNQLEIRGGKVLSGDHQIMTKSMPYFQKILYSCLQSPTFRDTLAWQQYWHAKKV